MSRIYEALRQLEGPAADSILSAIEVRAGAEDDQLVPEKLTVLPDPRIASDSVDVGCEPVPPVRRQANGLLVRCRNVPASLQTGGPVLPFDGSDARSAEQYRIVRTGLMHHSDHPTVIAISSAGPEDGKTVTAINVAGALSLKQDVSVLLVDADMRHGTVASRLGIKDEPGLTEVLSGECGLENAVVRLEQLQNLYVLPTGRAAVNPAELLDSEAWRVLIRTAREQFRFTILDTTPVALVTDYDLVEVVSDGAVLVVRPGHTNRKLWAEAVTKVSKRRLLGTVVNCVEDWFLWRTHGYYGYHGHKESR